jgi:hypothetical protein
MDPLKAHFDGLRQRVEEDYAKAIAPAAAERQSQLDVIAELERRMLPAAVPQPSTNGDRKPPGNAPSKVALVLEALSAEYKTVRQLSADSGLSGDEVSAALTRDSIRRVLKKRGEPGNFEYALAPPKPIRPRARPAKMGTTEAILHVLGKYPRGLPKGTLIDEVAKLTDSKTKHLRIAISSTIAGLVERGRVATDADGAHLGLPASELP